MDSAIDPADLEPQVSPTRLSDWLWRPWYAKSWWSAIPLWWVGMAASTRIDTLGAFYRGGIAGYLNVLFFPMTALMVLGVGYVRERLDSFVGQGGGTPLSDEEQSDDEDALVRRQNFEEQERLAKRWRAGFDPSDPRSGVLWIGNPSNPQSPGYINPHTGRHS